MRILFVEDGGGNIPLPQAAIGLFHDLFPGLSVFDPPYFNPRADMSEELPRLFDEHSLHEIVLCRSYTEWYRLRETEAIDFDVALIDINLGDYPTPKVQIPLEMPDFDFDKKAGLFIYHQLIRDEGIPDDKIAFLTGEANSLRSFAKKCQAAMMPRPANTFEKKDADFPKIRKWLETRAASPYSILRRGIIDGCRSLRRILAEIDEEDLEQQLIFFKSTDEDLGQNPGYFRDEIDRHLLWLETSLPLRKPKLPNAYYLRFIAELTGKWGNSRGSFLDENKPHSSSRLESIFYRSSQRLLKNIRNLSAHDKLSYAVSEADVAYCFLLSTRALIKLDFDMVFRYENQLGQLFDELSTEDFDNELREHIPAYLERSYQALSRDIRIKPDFDSYNYFMALWQAYIGEADLHTGSLREVMRREIRERSFELAYQSFWHGLFPLWFENDGYTGKRHAVFRLDEPVPENSFVHFLGRHILFRSFDQLDSENKQSDKVDVPESARR